MLHCPTQQNLRSPMHFFVIREMTDTIVWICLVNMGHINGDPQASAASRLQGCLNEFATVLRSLLKIIKNKRLP